MKQLYIHLVNIKKVEINYVNYLVVHKYNKNQHI